MEADTPLTPPPARAPCATHSDTLGGRGHAHTQSCRDTLHLALIAAVSSGSLLAVNLWN